MNPQPRFLDTEDVITLHSIAIEDQGGDPAIRDRALLESAVSIPRQQFGGAFLHEDIPTMAAAYAFHICSNHPFVDGNKRAALAAMLAFLSDNGWTFDADVNDAEQAMLDLASGSLDKAAFTAWSRQKMRQKPTMELREFFQRLTPEHLLTADEGFDLSPGQEMSASVREARATIPIAEFIIREGVQAEAAGDSDQSQRLRGQWQLLLMIYRAAEDMGYEW